MFTELNKITRLSNAVSAGTTDIESTSIDMAGFDEATFVADLGAIVSGAATVAKLQGSDNNSSFSDLADTGLTIADTDDNELVVLNIVRPVHRYLRMVIDRGTQNATVDSIVCIQSQAREVPVTQPTGVNVERHVSPAAGTA